MPPNDSWEVLSIDTFKPKFRPENAIACIMGECMCSIFVALADNESLLGLVILINLCSHISTCWYWDCALMI